uniref:heme ABC transporter substrate-binding protein n=1 Tax=Helicobacter rodentium TaxID=59617 RepID=UPI0025B7909E
MEQEKPKIVGKKIGQKIEQAFPKEFKNLNEHGIPFKISIEEVQEKVSGYSAGNGHDPLRDGTRKGKKIGYLCNKYQVTKNRKNKNHLNSKII